MIREHRSKAAVGQNPSFCLSFGFNFSRCTHSSLTFVPSIPGLSVSACSSPIRCPPTPQV